MTETCEDLRTLASVVENPSGYDSWLNYMGETEFPGLRVLLTQTRDSNALGRANFKAALDMLGGEKCGDDEREIVVIHRFGNWACGWWEALCVHEDAPEYKIALDIARGLENYPVVDEEVFSNEEREEADLVWRDCYSWRERAEYIRQHPCQFDLDYVGWRDLRAQIRGDWFGGWASEFLA